MCEDLKCNRQAVFDTLDIRAEAGHPVVGVEYAMPEAEVRLCGEKVDAQVSYKVFDKEYKEVPFTGNVLTFEKSGGYTLWVEASYNGLTNRLIPKKDKKKKQLEKSSNCFGLDETYDKARGIRERAQKIREKAR